MKALLVEDDLILNQQLLKQLTQHGYIVETALDGKEGLFLGLEYPIDIAIIDLGLPLLSGIEVIQQLRAKGKNFPILILTARSRWQEKVEGLDAGADDYLVKPFQIEELIARLNALQRRFAGWASPVLAFSEFTLDTKSQTLYKNELSTTQGKLKIELTAYEYKVLEYLLLHAGEVVSKSELTEHIYAQDFDRDSNVMEVFIRRLRKKLDPDNHLKPITTHRGSGYSISIQECANTTASSNKANT
ncbi:MAG: response regulator transcription factor [Pseudomonadota bacterium]